MHQHPMETALGWYWSERQEAWQRVRISAVDRAIHCYVIGASGSGKTKFLEALIRQDIDAEQGCGVIDPHGDLIEDLKGYIAVTGTSRGIAWLRERIVLVDLADPHQTVAFNPIELLPGITAGEQAAELISSFRKIWASSWGVRMEDLLRNSLIALAEAGRSLVDLPRFLMEANTRATILEHLSHPIARDYFRRFNQLSDRARLTWCEPVLNKINALLANDHVRHLLSPRQSTLHLREIIDSGKVLLVKLDKGRLKDAADLVGSLILAKLQLAVFSRSDTPAALRRSFYLYVDEFQNFASDNFAVFLSEARKYGLSLVLAHQTLAQIPEELQSLILGNAGLQVVFRVNRRDAERMAKEFFTYSGYEVKHASLGQIKTWSLGEEWEHYTEALQHQSPREAHVKHKIQGGLIPFRTADIPAAAAAAGMLSDEFARYIATIPIGGAYLRLRTAAQPVTPASSSCPPPLPTPDTALTEPRKMAPTRADQLPTAPSVAINPEDALESHPGPLANLDADEYAFLQLVLDHPAEPVSQLYRHYGASVWKGQRLRDRLIAAGYLTDLETRLGTRGRRAHYLLPTALAIRHQPIDLPNGRGGPVHRYLQHFVVAEARAKGHTAQVEHPLGDGNIVDVHVQRDSEIVAVEIAVTSSAARELEHVRACLAAGYGQVIALVLPESTRTALERLIGQTLPGTVRQRVTVLPTTKIGALL